MAHRQTQTPERILRIASGLFGLHGWEATTLQDIVSAAGVTKGAFYHYFSGKEALCEAVIDQAVSEVFILGQAIDRQQSPDDQLRQWLDQLNALNRSGQSNRFRLLVRLSADTYESNPTIGARLGRFWRGFLAELEPLYRQASHLEPAGDSARAVLARLAGTILLERYLPGS